MDGDLPRLRGMKRVAVFGNAGGGKSTLARDLAAISGLPLVAIDKLQFRDGGAPVPHEEYLRAHAELLARDEWIIDGFGCMKTLWERLDAADTLIHVDLPLLVHGLWVTKRLVKGFIAAPEGWPARSPMIGSSISSYRVLWPCHAKLTPRYRSYVREASARRRTFHLRSPRQLEELVLSARKEYAGRAAASA